MSTAVISSGTLYEPRSYNPSQQRLPSTSQAVEDDAEKKKKKKKAMRHVRNHHCQ